MAYFKNIPVLIFVAIFLWSCNDDFSHIGKHEKPRGEYAPNMYVSEAYEPLNQVTDPSFGEDYSSDSNNAFQMNMRVPAVGSIKRNTTGNWPYYVDSKKLVYLPYKYGPDSLDAAASVKSPLDTAGVVLKDGEILYKKFCQHCHGETGQGDGEVGKKLGGVPQYNGARLKGVSEGYIFHVITHGKGRMGPHGSQLNQEERWKIVRYVQTLQSRPTE
jgi:mono/diheme cytochrome c family protein